ncbi:WD repeat-containing protein 86, partial [Pteropus alecto]|uniref:WD repeat-containing protein 86 n=1 Tax=Pteropus alecto TaxID=9402 RepID=UPI000D532D36
MGGGGSALRVCAEHRGGINWLSLSPDGQRLLTGSEDGTARLWSAADGQCCALLQGHESYVTFCQLENEAAFTCSADRTIRKWDVLTGQCLQVFRGHTSIVNRILVANNQLFSSSYDRTARAWSVDAGQVSQEFRGHRNCVLTLAYSAPWDLPGAPFEEEAVAGGLLVTGSTDGTAKVWQVASGCCHQTLRGHTGAVLCLVLDTPSHTAFTGSTDTTIRAWDILSGEQLRVFREHQGSVICLEVRPAVCPGVPGSSPQPLPCSRVLVRPGRVSEGWGEGQLGLVSCEAARGLPSVSTFPLLIRIPVTLGGRRGPGGGPCDSAALPPAPRRPGGVEGGRPVARVSTVFTGSGDARARAFDAQSGALQRVFRGHAFVINCIQVGAPALPPAPEGGIEGEAAPVPTSPALHRRQDFLPEAEVPWAEMSPAVGLGSGRARRCPAC